MKSDYAAVVPYITKDGSEIRELMHPAIHGNERQSLAEARIRIGETTALHIHRGSEELYHIIRGRGEMQLGEARFEVAERDTVLIPPGTPHALRNSGEEELVLLCCCSPAYSHRDTELI